MQSSNIPSKIPLPFAYAAGSGYINPIPSASQIGIVNGRASLHDGFPPDTFTPVTAGGVPPFGGDFNGILNEITAIQQWQEAGGFFPFDAAFAATVGGYPKGAIIQSSTIPSAGFWVSTIENNSNNPDANGAGWIPTSFYGACYASISGSTTTLTNVQSAFPIIILQGALTANSTVIMPPFAKEWTVVNTTTGGFAVQVKTSGGVGVSIPNGQSSQLFCDGANIFSSNSASVSSFNGRTGSVSLNATDVDNALGYVPVAVADFIGSFGVNGYQKLPNGFILQWGQVVYNFTGETVWTLNFPIAFPNYCLVPSVSALLNNFNDDMTVGVWSYSAAQLSIAINYTTAGGENMSGFYWFALGY